MPKRLARGTFALAGLLAVGAVGALGAGCGADSGSTEASTTTKQLPRGREEQKRFRQQPQIQDGETTVVEPAP